MIKILEAPKKCADCPFVKITYGNPYCLANEYLHDVPKNGHRPKWCRLSFLEGKIVTWKLEEVIDEHN